MAYTLGVAAAYSANGERQFNTKTAKKAMEKKDPELANYKLHSVFLFRVKFQFSFSVRPDGDELHLRQEVT